MEFQKSHTPRMVSNRATAQTIISTAQTGSRNFFSTKTENASITPITVSPSATIEPLWRKRKIPHTAIAPPHTTSERLIKKGQNSTTVAPTAPVTAPTLREGVFVEKKKTAPPAMRVVTPQTVTIVFTVKAPLWHKTALSAIYSTTNTVSSEKIRFIIICI